MRLGSWACLALSEMFLLASGCGERPIGQPCVFSWPKAKDNQGGTVTDCSAFPACAPLRDENASSANQQKNIACPLDCIQVPSLECENPYCVATAIEGNHVNMNGRCGTDIQEKFITDCPEAPFGCMGYCSKECLSDASCPKDYKCSRLAPFSQTLNCDDETKWQAECTDSCIPFCSDGQFPCRNQSTQVISCCSNPADKINVDCPGGETPDYSLCDIAENRKCCTCICHQYCPLSTKKFCRRASWDQKMFPDAITESDECKDN